MNPAGFSKASGLPGTGCMKSVRPVAGFFYLNIFLADGGILIPMRSFGRPSQIYLKSIIFG
jgi:hypothetical protein